MNALSTLARRFSKAMEDGKGIRLGATELDLLAIIGANEVLQMAAATAAKTQCVDRAARRNSFAGSSKGLLELGASGPSDQPARAESGGRELEAKAALDRARRVVKNSDGRRRKQ